MDRHHLVRARQWKIQPGDRTALAHHCRSRRKSHRPARDADTEARARTQTGESSVATAAACLTLRREPVTSPTTEDVSAVASLVTQPSPGNGKPGRDTRGLLAVVRCVPVATAASLTALWRAEATAAAPGRGAHIAICHHRVAAYRVALTALDHGAGRPEAYGHPSNGPTSDAAARPRTVRGCLRRRPQRHNGRGPRSSSTSRPRYTGAWCRARRTTSACSPTSSPVSHPPTGQSTAPS